MATCMTEQQCKTVMAPALMAALPVARIQRRFPRKLLYGPLSAQGLGHHFLHTTQTLEHCSACLRHGDQDSLTGRLIVGSIETLIVKMGSSLPFWELIFKTWSPLMTDSWVKSTWRDTQHMGLTIEDTIERPWTQREGDIMLMDAFVARGFRKKELFTLNWCHMYLQAMRLSDITNAAGSHSHPNSWICKLRDNWSSQYE
jgi:hypothetical protein